MRVNYTRIALSDENERRVLRTRQAWQLTLQTKDISETDGKCAMLVDAYKGVESLVSPRFSSRSPITPVTTTGVAT